MSILTIESLLLINLAFLPLSFGLGQKIIISVLFAELIIVDLYLRSFLGSTAALLTHFFYKLYFDQFTNYQHKRPDFSYKGYKWEFQNSYLGNKRQQFDGQLCSKSMYIKSPFLLLYLFHERFKQLFSFLATEHHFSENYSQDKPEQLWNNFDYGRCGNFRQDIEDKVHHKELNSHQLSFFLAYPLIFSSSLHQDIFRLRLLHLSSMSQSHLLNAADEWHSKTINACDNVQSIVKEQRQEKKCKRISKGRTTAHSGFLFELQDKTILACLFYQRSDRIRYFLTQQFCF